jgi:hypothetical protein
MAFPQRAIRHAVYGAEMRTRRPYTPPPSNASLDTFEDRAKSFQTQHKTKKPFIYQHG